MIGIVWVNHHVLVRAITAVDRTLLFLNLVLLLFVVLIPFATATVADYLTKNDWDVKVAMALYGAVFLGMSVGFGSIFEWTLHGERWTGRCRGRRTGRRGCGSSAAGGVYVVAIVVSLFNAIIAFILIALVAVYYIVERTPAAAGARRVTRAALRHGDQAAR